MIFKGTGVKFKIILTASVILNVLLLGMTGGMIYKKWQWKSGRAHAIEADFAPEVRNTIARNFQAARNDMKSEFRDARAKRKQVVDILRAKNFDEKAYEKAVKDLEDVQSRMMVRRLEMLKDLALELPPEERKKISTKFMKPYGPHGKRGHGGKDKPKD